MIEATGQGGVGEAQPGFEFLNCEFSYQKINEDII